MLTNQGLTDDEARRANARKAVARAMIGSFASPVEWDQIVRELMTAEPMIRESNARNRLKQNAARLERKRRRKKSGR